MQCLAQSVNLCNMAAMKVGFLAGANPHALTIARHFSSLGVDCFGIGRGPVKPGPLFIAPDGYRYYQAHIGKQNGLVFEVLDLEQPSILINLCAQGEGAASFGPESWRFYQTNCAYLAQLVETLRKREWLQRFIHIGTSELYGSVTEPAHEDSPVIATSPYSISKAAFDAHLQVMRLVHGFPMNIVRPSNCITQGMQLHRIAPRAAISAVYGQRLKLQGGGAAQKSFLDTEDLAKGLLAVIEKGAVGETYNCGPENPMSIRDLVAMTIELTGAQWDDVVDEAPARVGEDSMYWLDSSKLRTLGWKPTVPIRQAVHRIVEWARAYPDVEKMDWQYRVTP